MLQPLTHPNVVNAMLALSPLAGRGRNDARRISLSVRSNLQPRHQ
jgi:hypothetical protein